MEPPANPGRFNRLMFWQTMAGEEEKAFVVPCLAARADTADQPGAAQVSTQGQGQVLVLPDTITTGAVLSHQRVVSTHLEWQASPPTTRILHSQPGSCTAVDLVGGWAIHDWRDGEALLATITAPWPRVMVVDWAALERELSPAACPPATAHLAFPAP